MISVKFVINADIPLSAIKYENKSDKRDWKYPANLSLIKNLSMLTKKF